jgi:hypothetical protein
MADISTAYGTPFGNSCALKFDIAPLFETLTNESFKGPTAVGVTTKWLGIVTINAIVGTLQSFTYEVFSSASSVTAETFLSFAPPQSESAVLTRGTVCDTNNMSFTFPISSPKEDYFVLVTPTFMELPNDVQQFINRRSRNQHDVNETTTAYFNGPHRQTVDNTLVGQAEAQNRNKASIIAASQPTAVTSKKFAIFYTSKILKKRKEASEAYKQQSATKQEYVSFDPRSSVKPTKPIPRSRILVNQIPVPQNEEYATQKPDTDGNVPIIPHNSVFEIPKFVSKYQTPGEWEETLVTEKSKEDKDFETMLRENTDIFPKLPSFLDFTLPNDFTGESFFKECDDAKKNFHNANN